MDPPHDVSWQEEAKGTQLLEGERWSSHEWRVKEEHLNNEMKKEKQKNLECSSNAFENDEKSKIIIFKWKQFISGREAENSYHWKQN